MDKIKEALLADLKKSNKVRKLKLAQKYGFTTIEEYVKYLTGIITEKPKVEVTPETNVVTDMVIAFDTTGSMSMYIEAVKKHVKQLIPELFQENKNLRVSIVAFGDYCDMKSSKEFGKAYQVVGLTDDKNKLIDFVTEAKSTSGGDGDEFYELVLQKVRTETAWRNESNKSLLLIGDCNPHEVGYSYEQIVKNAQIDWREEAKQYAKEGIKVDTLSILGDAFYVKLSGMTGGVNIKFQSAGKTEELLRGYSHARSGSTVSFTTAYASVTASGDSELIGAYKTLSTL